MDRGTSCVTFYNHIGPVHGHVISSCLMEVVKAKYYD